MNHELPHVKPPAAEKLESVPSPVKKSETLTTGKEIFSRMLGMIGDAKQSIDMQFYTFEADATGRKILAALKAAKEKNPKLQIRILIDGSNDFRHDSKSVWASPEARKKRDETYELINQMRDEGIFDAKMTNWFSHNPILFTNIIHRNHKKSLLIDAALGEGMDNSHEQALITSANIAWYHESERKELGRVYHGTHGPVPLIEQDFEHDFENAQKWERVYSVRNIPEYFQKYLFRKDFWKHFRHDWIGSLVRNPQRPGERLVFGPGPKGHDSAVLTDSFWGEMPIVGKRLGAREATNEAFTMLDLAKKGEKVVVFTPYPGIHYLTNHLIDAAKRGVDVHLVIAENYEQEIINPKDPEGLIGKFFANWPKKLVGSNVHVHEYLGEKEGNNGLLHAKGALWIRDDGSVRTLIGSTNFSKGPISGMNREIAVVEESDLSDPLVAYADSLIEDSKPLQLPEPYRRRKR